MDHVVVRITEDQLHVAPARRTFDRLASMLLILAALIWGFTELSGFWNPLVWLAAIALVGTGIAIGVWPVYSGSRIRTVDAWCYVSFPKDRLPVVNGPRRRPGPGGLLSGWLHIDSNGLSWSPGGVYRRQRRSQLLTWRWDELEQVDVSRVRQFLGFTGGGISLVLRGDSEPWQGNFAGRRKSLSTGLRQNAPRGPD